MTSISVESVLTDMARLWQDGSRASMTFEMRFKDPEEPAIATLKWHVGHIDFDGDGRVAAGCGTASDWPAMLRSAWTGAARSQAATAR